MNPVLLKIYGDRSCTLNATNSTLSFDVLKILTGNTVAVKTVKIPRVEKGVTAVTNAITLSKTPVAASNITVYKTNAYNENIEKWTKVVSAPSAKQYMVSGATITFASGVADSFNIYYYENIESEVLEAAAGANPIFSANAKCLIQGISNKKLYMGDIIINACQISPSITFGAKNSSDVPDPSNLSLELLSLNDIAPYVIATSEISTAEGLM